MCQSQAHLAVDRHEPQRHERRGAIGPQCGQDSGVGLCQEGRDLRFLQSHLHSAVISARAVTDAAGPTGYRLSKPDREISWLSRPNARGRPPERLSNGCM